MNDSQIEEHFNSCFPVVGKDCKICDMPQELDAKYLEGKQDGRSELAKAILEVLRKEISDELGRETTKEATKTLKPQRRDPKAILEVLRKEISDELGRETTKEATKTK